MTKSKRRLTIPPGGGTEKTPYPHFDVASENKWAFDWDEKTRQLITDRVENVPAFRFFSTEEARLLEAICSRLIPQEDRPMGERIPIAPWIDKRLFEGKGDGYRYEDMPDDREAYRRGLMEFDRVSQEFFQEDFTELAADQQDQTIAHIAEKSARFFQELMNDVISNYYAHPAAWAEIGFNGPSSPRGHIRLELGRRDPWEAKEEKPISSVDIVRRAQQKHQGSSQGEATH